MTMFTTTTIKSVTILTVGLLSANLYGCSEKDANTCIAQGKPFGGKKPKDDCCSGVADTTNDKLCGCIAAGAALPKHSKDGKDCCAPAAASSDKKTCCIPKGGEADKHDQCCSGILSDGKCSDEAKKQKVVLNSMGTKMNCEDLLKNPTWHNLKSDALSAACPAESVIAKLCQNKMKDYDGTYLSTDCSVANANLQDSSTWKAVANPGDAAKGYSSSCSQVALDGTVWTKKDLGDDLKSSDKTKFKDACPVTYDLISRCHKAGLTYQHACSEKNIQAAGEL